MKTLFTVTIVTGGIKWVNIFYKQFALIKIG